jgi:hypothetical protein
MRATAWLLSCALRLRFLPKQLRQPHIQRPRNLVERLQRRICAASFQGADQRLPRACFVCQVVLRNKRVVKTGDRPTVRWSLPADSQLPIGSAGLAS